MFCFFFHSSFVVRLNQFAFFVSLLVSCFKISFASYVFGSLTNEKFAFEKEQKTFAHCHRAVVSHEDDNNNNNNNNDNDDDIQMTCVYTLHIEQVLFALYISHLLCVLCMYEYYCTKWEPVYHFILAFEWARQQRDREKEKMRGRITNRYMCVFVCVSVLCITLNDYTSMNSMWLHILVKYSFLFHSYLILFSTIFSILFPHFSFPLCVTS